MDPLTLATGITALISGITKLSLEIAVLVGALRDAQNDMNRVKTELETLTSVLLQIQHMDNSRLPPQLVQSLPTVLNSCTDVVVEMIKILQKLSNRGGIRRKIQWVTTSKSDVGSLRANLEAHKSTLHLAIMIGSTQSDQLILGEIALLQRSLPRGGTGFALQRFLEDTATYAGSYYGGSVVDDDRTVLQDFGDDRGGGSFEESPRKVLERPKSPDTIFERPIITRRPPETPQIQHNIQAVKPGTRADLGRLLRNERSRQREESANQIAAARSARPETTNSSPPENVEIDLWGSFPPVMKRRKSSTNSTGRFFCWKRGCPYNEASFLGYHTKEELDAHIKSHELQGGGATAMPAVEINQRERRMEARKRLLLDLSPDPSRYFCSFRNCSYHRDRFLGWHTEDALLSHMRTQHKSTFF